LKRNIAQVTNCEEPDKAIDSTRFNVGGFESVTVALRDLSEEIYNLSFFFPFKRVGGIITLPPLSMTTDNQAKVSTVPTDQHPSAVKNMPTPYIPLTC